MSNLKRKLFEDFIETIDDDDIAVQHSIEDKREIYRFQTKFNMTNFVNRSDKSELAKQFHLFERKIRLIASRSMTIYSIEGFKYFALKYGRSEDNQIQLDSTITLNISDNIKLSEIYDFACQITMKLKPIRSARNVVALYKDFFRFTNIEGKIYGNSDPELIFETEDLKRNWENELDIEHSDFSVCGKEIFELAKVVAPDMTYGKFLEDLSSNGFCFILRNHLSDSDDSIQELMNKYVRYIGHFERFGHPDPLGLPDHMRGSHAPIVGCTTIFKPFGEKDCSISAPWSPTQRSQEIRQFCESTPVDVYMIRKEIDDKNGEDTIFCLFSKTFVNSKGQELQIATETTGHEMGIISKELTLSSFMSYEDAKEECADFFRESIDDDDDY